MDNYSVLMSVYHKEKAEFLREALDSIWNQTVQTDDFVLVCDGPSKLVCTYLDELYKRLNLSTPSANEAEYMLLASSVNVDRLKNHPIALDKESIDYLYHKILGNSEL